MSRLPGRSRLEGIDLAARRQSDVRPSFDPSPHRSHPARRAHGRRGRRVLVCRQWRHADAAFAATPARSRRSRLSPRRNRPRRPPPSRRPSPRRPQTPEPTEAPSGATSVKIYLFMDGTLVPVRRQVDATRAVGRAALNALFEGPTAEERTHHRPSPRACRKARSCLAWTSPTGWRRSTCRASSNPVAAAPRCSGGSAQVVYTLTQFPTVKQVAFQIDGEPVTSSRARDRPRRAVGPRGLRGRSCRRSSWSGRRGARPSATLSG